MIMIGLDILCELFIYLIFGIIIVAILRIWVKSTEIYVNWEHAHAHSTHPTHSTTSADQSTTTLPSFPELTKGEPLNLIGMIILLIFQMWFIAIKVGFEFDGTAGDLPGKILAIIPASIVVFVVIENLIKALLKIKKKRRYGLPSEEIDQTEDVRLEIDVRRKSWHVVAFLLAVGMLLIGWNVIKNYFAHTTTTTESQFILDNFWRNSEGLSFVDYLFIRVSLPFGQNLMVFFMYGMMMLLFVNDITRLSKNMQFILNRNAQRKMRYKELDTFAAYTHFAIGYLFAAMVLPPMLFLGALCLASFADPAASYIGIRWGKKKHRYSWNQKSIEGTIAGSLAAFVTMIFFIGPIGALLGAILFSIVDICTPTPVKMSDNLVLPVTITILLVILALLGVPLTNIFGV
jgi:dolichol kinase